MRSLRATGLKFTAFAVVMVVATAFLFMTFAQYRTGPTNEYTAVFTDVSRLKPGDSVRAAGIRIGTVDTVTLRSDATALVTFEADREVALTTATKAAVRYLNLVGDRYLELIDAPGPTTMLPAGSQIPIDRTSPALDLDLLLSGLKPVIQSLSPRDVNALTSSLVQILQGQGGTVESLFAKTSSFTNALADNDSVIAQLIDNLKVVLSALTTEGDRFSTAIDRIEKLITGFAGDRDPIGAAIDALDAGTASLADLLTHARAPLAGTVNELSRLAPILDQDKERVDLALTKAPENYRKLTRLGAYGSFIQMYVCGMSVRVTDLEGRTAVFPWLKQTGGRCAEP
ncbi:MCE family protein [Mycolicibacterium sphagni]|uniref:MCE family protein n=1 Tax=Mycolicibacterium sphagni TaxID=1786 RepID=A0ABX2K7A7_9MYCO|nr:MCE family protein [Mycolicibacterium sphagni]NTY62911.1 MCE family protein [Mycolicibacterium sphagni]